MFEPGEVVRLRGSTQDWTIKTARYDDEKLMTFYSFAEGTVGSTGQPEVPGTMIAGVVSQR